MNGLTYNILWTLLWFAFIITLILISNQLAFLFLLFIWLMGMSTKI